MRGRLRRDLLALRVSMVLVLMAAVSMLFSFRWGPALILGVGIGYLVYRLVECGVCRFRGEHPIRLVLLVGLAIAAMLSLMGMGEQPFVIFLILGFDYMMVQRICTSKGR